MSHYAKVGHGLSISSDSTLLQRTRIETGHEVRLGPGPCVQTCIIQAQCEEGPTGPLGTIRPDFVNKVVLHRNQVVAGTSQDLGHLLPVI
jgi:hypothetical protein